MKIEEVKAYLLGKFRYFLFDKKDLNFLIRRHIYEQILWRISVMDKECYDNGACKICGCQTTALQMANKACPKPCYPEMMNKKEWKKFKENNYQ